MLQSQVALCKSICDLVFELIKLCFRLFFVSFLTRIDQYDFFSADTNTIFFFLNHPHVTYTSEDFERFGEDFWKTISLHLLTS